jgi:hypothetical protein
MIVFFDAPAASTRRSRAARITGIVNVTRHCSSRGT